jgi:transposase
VQAARILSRLPTRYGPRCRRTCQPRAPAVLPQRLYGNPRIATATTRHSLHGRPLGRVCEPTGLGPGSVVAVFPRLARVVAGIPDRLRPESRQAPVKHAAETSWRTTGHQGDAWLFATPRLSRFLCRQTRAARVPQPVFGQPWLPGGLVVDRDGGSHQVPCAIQDGYSQLRREVQDREQDCPEAAAVTALVRTVAPQLARALGRRAPPRSDAEFARQATALNAPRMTSLAEPAQHLGLRRLHEIFRAHVDRLDHWAEDRRIPAEHHLAERHRRPTGLARKVSCGSPSEAGAHTRGVLLAVLHTLKKRGRDGVAHLTGVLDRLADAIHQDPWRRLFPEGPT